MRDDITKTDGLADGLLIGTVAAFPIYRGAVNAVGSVVEASRRRAIIDKSIALAQAAKDLKAMVLPHLDEIGQALSAAGMDVARRDIQESLRFLDERIAWFTRKNIAEFVDQNDGVRAALLERELGEFVTGPVRESVDSIRMKIGSEPSAALRKLLSKLEFELVKFAAEKMNADISRDHEKNQLFSRWLVKRVRIAAILLVGAAAFIGIAMISLI